MIHEYFCRPKEKLYCFYITGGNVDEFVRDYGFSGKYTISVDKNFAFVRYESMVWQIRLNAFIVYEHDGWVSYTKEEFDETYSIVF